VRRVEFDHVVRPGHQPRHQRAVVVPGGLHPDPQRQRGPLRPRGRQGRLQLADPVLGQRELHRGRDHLAVVIGHQRQRRLLADIHRGDQAAGQVQAAGALT
jgi:hypothetical protein